MRSTPVALWRSAWVRVPARAATRTSDPWARSINAGGGGPRGRGGVGGHGPGPAEAAGVGNRRYHVPAVAERQDRELHPQHVADTRLHGSAPLRLTSKRAATAARQPSAVGPNRSGALAPLGRLLGRGLLGAGLLGAGLLGRRLLGARALLGG